MKTKYVCRGLISLYVVMWSTNLHVNICKWGGGGGKRTLSSCKSCSLGPYRGEIPSFVKLSLFYVFSATGGEGSNQTSEYQDTGKCAIKINSSLTVYMDDDCLKFACSFYEKFTPPP